MTHMTRKPTQKVAFICSYTPRKCGIATFTSDLIANVGRAGADGFAPAVIAMQSEAELAYAAEELLARGRGKFVPFGDSANMAQTIIEILRNKSLFLRMRRQMENM